MEDKAIDETMSATYTHADKGGAYWIMDSCLIKMPDGSWEDGYMYARESEHEGFSHEDQLVFVRTQKSFNERMKKV
jgi:hypothetical protein